VALPSWILLRAPARGANAFAKAGEVGDTCRAKLDDYLDSFQQVLDHPRHRAAQETLVELIRQLRACTNVNEGYEWEAWPTWPGSGRFTPTASLPRRPRTRPPPSGPKCSERSGIETS